MNMRILAVTFITGCLFTFQAHAETMECDEEIIEDGGTSGPMLAEVIEKCGEPTSQEGDSYVYEKENATYVLVFDDAGNLDSITVNVDD